MRFVLILVGGLAVLYGGYWFIGAQAATAAVTRGLDRMQDRGLEVAWSDIATVGFPSRFDTTVSDLRLTDPARGIGWQAPFVQLFALSTQPNHVIVVWPDRQVLDLPGRQLTLTSASLRASARARPSPALPLREATLEGRALTLAADAGWEVDVAALLAAVRAVSGEAVAPNSYDVFAEATDITLPTVLLQALGGAEAVPAMAERLRLDGRVALTAPLDRFARDTRPVLEAVTLRDLTFRWGDVEVAGTGDVTVDGTGLAQGHLTLQVRNWERLIEMAQTAGAVSDPQARAMIRAAGALAESGTLQAQVTFRNGFTTLGPLPIGPAPRLR